MEVEAVVEARQQGMLDPVGNLLGDGARLAAVFVLREWQALGIFGDQHARTHRQRRFWSVSDNGGYWLDTVCVDALRVSA